MEMSSQEMIALNKRIMADHEKLEVIFESLADGIIYVNEGWEVLFVNSEVLRILGRERAEMADQPFDSFLNLESLGITDFDRSVKTSASYWSDSGVICHSDEKEVPVSTHVQRVVAGSENSGWIVLLRDLTEKQQTEAALQAAKIEMEANKLAESVKGQFLA